MQIDFAAREVSIKLVYYGPAMSGKTTNLVSLHAKTGADSRGRLMTLETQNDRTLFFDLLPLTFRSKEGDIALRIKLFTVPGQQVHTGTRRLVLQGADGVTLVADSRVSETQKNADSFLDLRQNLRENGLELSKMPLVIQFNKRDLPEVRTEAELAELARRGKEPVYLATATRGDGVVETFLGLLDLTLRTLERTNQLSTRLGMDRAGLLTSAAQQLGATEPVTALLDRCVGGGYDAKVGLGK